MASFTFDRNAKVQFAALLKEALEQPGILSAAYRSFHRYSFLNRLNAMIQCQARGIEPGPIAPFSKWKEKGRWVKKGEKAIWLCMPINIPARDADGQRVIDEKTGKPVTRKIFEYKPNWFVLSQTEGQDAQPEPAPGFDYAKMLRTLKIQQESFSRADGNCQGYAYRNAATKQLTIAVSPVAQYAHKTMFHEVAHCLLHFNERDVTQFVDRAALTVNEKEVEAEMTAYLVISTLELPGKTESRGYIQAWLSGKELTDTMARRIMGAADKIISAGMLDLEQSAAA